MKLLDRIKALHQPRQVKWDNWAVDVRKAAGSRGGVANHLRNNIAMVLESSYAENVFALADVHMQPQDMQLITALLDRLEDDNHLACTEVHSNGVRAVIDMILIMTGQGWDRDLDYDTPFPLEDWPQGYAALLKRGKDSLARAGKI